MRREKGDVVVGRGERLIAPWLQVECTLRRITPRKRLPLECPDTLRPIRLLEQRARSAGVRLKRPRHVFHVVEGHRRGLRGATPASPSATTTAALRERPGTEAK